MGSDLNNERRKSNVLLVSKQVALWAVRYWRRSGKRRHWGREMTPLANVTNSHLTRYSAPWVRGDLTIIRGFTRGNFGHRLGRDNCRHQLLVISTTEMAGVI